MNKMVVLGISLGSRTTGIAVIKGNELLVCRSLTLRNKSTNIHTSTVDNYIKQYRIFTVVIKIPPASHITKRIEELLDHCLSIFHYHGCMVEYKETAAIKEHMPLLKNKAEIIRFTSKAYPDLTSFQSKELSNKQKYHVKMFEAVLIAHLKKLEQTL